MSRFLRFAGMLLAALAMAYWLAGRVWPVWPARAGIITIYLFIITTALVFYLMRIQHICPKKFTIFFLATMMVKLAGNVVFLLALALTDRSALFYDAVYFISLYVICTLLSVVTLYRQAGS